MFHSPRFFSDMTPQEKSIEKEIEGEPEDGEISDDDDDAPMELPTNQPNCRIELFHIFFRIYSFFSID